MPTPAYMRIEGEKQGLITAGTFTEDSVGNIFQEGHEDEVLVELSQQARDLIEGVSPAGIKKNDVMLQKIKNEMNELKFAIDSAIEDMPRRKIRMAV